jgi:hypothetical protein
MKDETVATNDRVRGFVMQYILTHYVLYIAIALMCVCTMRTEKIQYLKYN